MGIYTQVRMHTEHIGYYRAHQVIGIIGNTMTEQLIQSNSDNSYVPQTAMYVILI
jgi:hypothetical protein